MKPKPEGGHTNENGTGYWAWCPFRREWLWYWDARQTDPKPTQGKDS